MSAMFDAPDSRTDHSFEVTHFGKTPSTPAHMADARTHASPCDAMATARARLARQKLEAARGPRVRPEAASGVGSQSCLSIPDLKWKGEAREKQCHFVQSTAGTDTKKHDLDMATALIHCDQKVGCPGWSSDSNVVQTGHPGL